MPCAPVKLSALADFFCFFVCLFCWSDGRIAQLTTLKLSENARIASTRLGGDCYVSLARPINNPPRPRCDSPLARALPACVRAHFGHFTFTHHSRAPPPPPRRRVVVVASDGRYSSARVVHSRVCTFGGYTSAHNNTCTNACVVVVVWHIYGPFVSCCSALLHTQILYNATTGENAE